MIYYHGTSSEDFERFEQAIVYLTSDWKEALAFAKNPILGGGRGVGVSRILKVEAKEGKTKDISTTVDETIMTDGDLDEVLVAETVKSREEGYRYLSFLHPPTHHEGEFRAIISLYPSEDIHILEVAKLP